MALPKWVVWVLALATLPAFGSELTPQETAMLEQMRSAAKAQGITMTPEMEQMALDSARRMQAQALGMQAAAGAMRAQAGARNPDAIVPEAPSAVINSVAVASEPQMGMLTFPSSEEGKPAHFEDLRDGFKANGQVWLDPEGAIDLYAANAATGDVTYLVAQGGGRYLVKYANVNLTTGAVRVGHLTRTQGRDEYEGVDGQRLLADNIILVARGLLGYRVGSLFHLEFGQPLKPYALPEDFQVTPWQTGDVSGTGYVLLYKRTSGGFTKYAKATLGKNTQSDMMFFNLHTGATVPIAVSGLKMKTGTNRYDDTGLRDDEHVYWRARWYATPDGAIAMVKEDGPSRLTVLNLDTGARAVAFERKLGLGNWDLYPTADGKLRFTGSWAFKRHEIEDVAALLTQ